LTNYQHHLQQLHNGVDQVNKNLELELTRCLWVLVSLVRCDAALSSFMPDAGY